MITWLQALIEKRGKWLFIALLAIVIFSFVPYISPTGSSSLDLFSDDAQRGSDQYFGYDWYDPNDQRSLTMQATVSGAFGTSPRPNQNAWLETLREVYSGQLDQSGFQNRRARLAMEAKIALLQIGAAWKLLPVALENDAIVKEFREFLSSRVDERVGITQDGELDADKYEKVIQNIAKGLGGLNTNQVQAILFEDFRSEHVDAALSAAGFALPLEGELEIRGNDLLWKFEAVSLDGESFEPDPLPFASIRLRSLPEDNATLTLSYNNSSKTFTFRENLPEKPAEGDVALGSGDSAEAKLVSTRDNLAVAMKKTGLGYAVSNADENESSTGLGLDLSLPSDGAPFEMPRISASSEAFSFTNELEKELIAYYEGRKEDALFMEPARTGVTALEFTYQKYLKKPSPPTETELRSYFALHPGEFSRPPAKESPPTENKSLDPEVKPEKDGERGPRGPRKNPLLRRSHKPKTEKVEDKPSSVPKKEEEQPVPPVTPADPSPSGKTEPSSTPKPLPDANGSPVPDANGTQVSDRNATVSVSAPKEPEPGPPITFEEVRQEVLARVLKERRVDLEAEARDLAEKRAEDFVSALHALSRKSMEKGVDPLKIRNNPGTASLIERFQPSDRRKAAFSEGEIDNMARAVNLPADALSDMLELPAHRFFSEAAYETNDGFAVMLLDARLVPSVKEFDRADFRVLLREFRMERKKEGFQARGEELAEALGKGLEEGLSLAKVASKVDSRLSHHSFEGDDDKIIRERFDKRSKKLDREVEKAQADLDKLVELTKDRNATAAEQTEINGLREGIKDRRDRLAQIADERGLAEDLFAVASDADTKPGELTGMVTGESTKAGLFVRLHEIIWEKEDEETSLVEESVDGLETRRASESRENLLSDWIEKGRGQP